MSSSTDNVYDMIMNAHEFNPKTDIIFADPKVNPKTSGKSVGIINNKNKSSLKLRFPLALTWGAQLYTDPSSNKESYSMSIQFPGDGYNTPLTDKWLANMTAMEDTVLTHVMANWKKLFNKPAPSKEAAEVLYTRSLKYSRDTNTGEINMAKSPTMKVKLGYWDNKFDCEIYSPEGKMLYSQETHPTSSPVDLIPKASQTAVIVQCGGIWFAGGKFGVTWKLLQAVVKPKPTMKGKCLISLTQEDRAVISTQQIVPEEEYADDSVTAMVIADDSDEEEEPVAAPVVVAVAKPVPVPVVVAPVVVAPVVVAPVVAAAPVEKKKMVVKKKIVAKDE
jgi:hypothetical protein